MLTPVDKGIFFIFADDTSSTHFKNKTASGIIVQGGPQSDQPRWGGVIQVGGNVEGIEVGDCILIEKGGWTPGFVTDGVRMWKTDETKVLVVSDEPYAIL